MLVPDGESHLLWDVVHCLARDKRIEIFVLSNSAGNPMKYSRYIHKFSHAGDPNDPKGWISLIDAHVERWKIDVILPIFEIGIRKLIEYGPLLHHKDKLVAWPDLDRFDCAIDKWKLSRHLTAHHIPAPRTFEVRSEARVGELLPLMVKPNKGFGGGMGVRLLADQAQWDAFLGEIEGSKTTFIAQEYIKGDDYCCNVLCLDGEVLCHTIQKGIMWGGHRFGAQLGHGFIDDPQILEIGSKLMKSLNWSGVACMDIRFDEGEKVFKIIEINTRYWRSLLGSLAAGVNFPVRSVYGHLGLEVEPMPYRKIQYYNLKGFLRYLKADPKRILKFRFLWRNTALRFALLDPLPMVYKLFTRNW